MTFRPSAFGTDKLTLTRWELVKLFLGHVIMIRGGIALEIKAGK